MNDKVGKTIFNAISENVEALSKIFPSAVKDGQVDFDALRAELGKFEEVGTGVGTEKYEFTWNGKAKAKAAANTDISGRTLRYKKGDGVDEDTTQNLYIEGDNLEALKLLRNSYFNRIKMIYIDPPYNTGNDFVYRDNFSMTAEELSALKAAAGDVDEDGNILVKNSKDAAKYHTNWCNMIYPRLKIARDLLTDDGVIFISIDDNEASNLRKICDEIFGIDNYIETFYLQVRYAEKSLNEKDDFQKLVEQVLIYAKSRGEFKPDKPFEEYSLEPFEWEIKELAQGEQMVLGGKKVTLFKQGQYVINKVPSSIKALKATWASGSVLKGNTSGKFFDTQLSPRIETDGLRCLYKVDGIGEDGIGYRYFTGPKKEGATKGQFYSGVPTARVDELEIGSSKKFKTIGNFYDYSGDFGNISHEGGVAFRGGKKPTKMMLDFLRIANVGISDNVLDFFSGSASTAHAVMLKNFEDNGKRKFIMVQLPEITDEKSDYRAAGFANICEIGKERIRRAGKKIKDDSPITTTDLDIGFKVFKVADTNIRLFKSELHGEELELWASSSNAEARDFTEGYNDLDVVYELLIRHRNVPLSSKIEVVKSVGERTFIIADTIVVCLEAKLTDTQINTLAKLDPTPKKFIFRDSAFGDDINLKLNTMTELNALIRANTGDNKSAYKVEFI